MADGPELYVGLISGTSVDGIDAALVEFQGERMALRAALTHPWEPALRECLLAAAQDGAPQDLDALGRLDHDVGAGFAAAARRLLQQAGCAAHGIRAIGSHGQTIRHRPAGTSPFTLQIGDPALIAERLGIDVVADFRRADIAAGGQGAPLVPALHAALLAAPGRTRVVLNLGGIANVTVLHADGRVTGFDTGPANGLMDAWCQRERGLPFDRDGAFAAGGNVDGALLGALLADPWFALPPPKSTGREYFHLAWLGRHARAAALPPADVQATLLELTVRSVADAIARFAGTADAVLVCGGGVHNRALMERLAARLAPVTVDSTANCGIDPDFVEAMAFAWLARQRLLGRPGNLPAVTGARGPRVLGGWYRAARSGG